MRNHRSWFQHALEHY